MAKAKQSGDRVVPSVVVLGDRIVDEWNDMNVVKLSAEAPVPVVTWAGQPRRQPGGASLVAAALEEYLGGSGMAVRQPLMFHVGNPVSQKVRYVDVASQQQLLRVDRDVTAESIATEWRKSLAELLAPAADSVSNIVVVDYDKGAVTDELLDQLIYWLAGNLTRRLFVHTKRYDWWHSNVGPRATYFFNRSEYDALDRVPLQRVITDGVDGGWFMLPVEPYRGSWQAYNVANVRSTCGAGDVFMAATVAKRVVGATWQRAVDWAAVAAGLTVALPRSEYATLADVEQAFRGEASAEAA